jgi:hypothetical protein
VSRHDPVKVLIGPVKGCRIADPKVNFLVCLFGFTSGVIDHLRGKIDAGSRVAKFRKPQGQKAGAAPNVKYLLGRQPNKPGKQIEPRKALSVTDEAVARFLVEGVRAAIPVPSDDLGDLVDVLAHVDSALRGACPLLSPYPDSSKKHALR